MSLKPQLFLCPCIPRLIAFVVVHSLFFSALSVWAKPLSVEEALSQLESGDSQLRVEAVLYLGKSLDSRAVEPIMKLLNDDDEPRVRMASALSLGGLKDRRVIGQQYLVLYLGWIWNQPAAYRGRGENQSWQCRANFSLPLYGVQ